MNFFDTKENIEAAVSYSKYLFQLIADCEERIGKDLKFYLDSCGKERCFAVTVDHKHLSYYDLASVFYYLHYFQMPLCKCVMDKPLKIDEERVLEHILMAIKLLENLNVKYELAPPAVKEWLGV